MRYLDLFAGAGGWDVAAHKLGWTGDRVENDQAANTAALLAGFSTKYLDVLGVMPADIAPHKIQMASPPCQTFSAGGKGSGRAETEHILAAIKDPGRIKYVTDPRTRLVLEPLRFALALAPDLLAWEQVPSVLPIWEAAAETLRGYWGYSVWTGLLNAEQYGVPQTRKRAILMARRDGVQARPPAPTHSQFHRMAPKRLDEDVMPWRTMENAIGWGLTHRPYPVIASARVTGGPDKEKLGGSGARSLVYRERAEGRWVKGPNEWADGAEGFRITMQETGLIQSFPTDYPWYGTDRQKFRQIGNAIPPYLAGAILRTLAADS